MPPFVSPFGGGSVESGSGLAPAAKRRTKEELAQNPLAPPPGQTTGNALTGVTPVQPSGPMASQGAPVASSVPRVTVQATGVAPTSLAPPPEAIRAAPDPDELANAAWNAGAQKMNAGGSWITRTAPSLGQYVMANQGRASQYASDVGSALGAQKQALSSGAAFKSPFGGAPVGVAGGLLNAAVLGSAGSDALRATGQQELMTAGRKKDLGMVGGLLDLVRTPFAADPQAQAQHIALRTPGALNAAPATRKVTRPGTVTRPGMR